MKNLLKAALAGGLIAFIWMNISWMVLPWHQKTISSLPNEASMAQAIRSNVTESGLYILPWTEEKSQEAQEKINKKVKEGPFGYMVVHPKGIDLSMPKMMMLGLLFNIIVASILSYLLSKTKGLSYLEKVGFVKLAALAGAIVIVVPNLIWWHFPLSYGLVTLIDTALAWGFAGLAIGKIVKD